MESLLRSICFSKPFRFYYWQIHCGYCVWNPFTVAYFHHIISRNINYYTFSYGALKVFLSLDRHLLKCDVFKSASRFMNFQFICCSEGGCAFRNGTFKAWLWTSVNTGNVRVTLFTVPKPSIAARKSAWVTLQLTPTLVIDLVLLIREFLVAARRGTFKNLGFRCLHLEIGRGTLILLGLNLGLMYSCYENESKLQR